MLGPMGKRDTELETDAELWARVARSAKPIAKGRIAAAVEAPKPRAKAPAKEPAPPPAKPAPKPVVKAAPTARGEALNRQTARQLERGKLPVAGVPPPYSRAFGSPAPSCGQPSADQVRLRIPRREMPPAFASL